MGIYQPPARSTAACLRRLRYGFAAIAFVAIPLAHMAPTRAAGSSLRILVWAVVAEPARNTMSQALWTKDVNAYVGGNVIPFAGDAAPLLADCKAAGADYAIAAPFDLRPSLPGLANANGRVAARTHLVVTNCIAGTTSFDQTVMFESDVPSIASDGDFDSVPEVTWARGVPATLAKLPLTFERVARVIKINSPLALIDIKLGSVHAGDALRDFAHADRSLRKAPIIMTVTQAFDKYLEVMFSSLGETPNVGDLVEPVSNANAPGTPTPPAR